MMQLRGKKNSKGCQKDQKLKGKETLFPRPFGGSVNLPTPCFQTSSLQKGECVSCSCHSVCSNLLEQLRGANIVKLRLSNKETPKPQGLKKGVLFLTPSKSDLCRSPQPFSTLLSRMTISKFTVAGEVRTETSSPCV